MANPRHPQPRHPTPAIVAPETAASASEEPYPLLKTIPKQKGARNAGACPLCSRDVILSQGGNDGKLCTTCFNTHNKQQAAKNRKAAQASRAMSQPTTNVVNRPLRSPTAARSTATKTLPTAQSSEPSYMSSSTPGPINIGGTGAFGYQYSLEAVVSRQEDGGCNLALVWTEIRSPKTERGSMRRQ